MTEEKTKGTADPAAQQMLKKAREANIETAWDRFDAMQDICAFGDLGLCCRNCMIGPCRIDPFGEGPRKGVCGISSDGMVARNLCRMIAAGASAHSDHGAHILEALERIASGHSSDFKIKDAEKLKRVAAQLGLSENGGGTLELIRLLVGKVKEAYGQLGGESDWLLRTIPAPRVEKLRSLCVLPSSIDPTIRETMHRTHMGVDADPLNLLLGGIKCSLADFLGMDVASNLSDILLGTPMPVFSEANLGVLDADAVNVAVHGHHPLISESILAAVPELDQEAKEAGAANGFNIVGICCTGNEVLMRHGIPLATNAASQELAVITGAIDAMVVDVQCVMPSLANVCECYHTKLFTTMSIAKIPGATHIEFDPAHAKQSAREMLEAAIQSFKNRDPKRVDIPDVKRETMVGFSPEAIISVLQKVNPEDPLQPLIERIARGAIYGIVLFAGCNNYKVVQDSSFIAIAEKLAADNVLLLATGCAAGAFGKRGFLSPQATEELCGEELKRVLTDLGHAAGLDRPLPPVWHIGSCVDNSRAARLAFAIANKLNVDVSQLPVVASAPEAMSEKSVAIGTGAVALGLTTHLGVVPPVLGGKIVTKVLTETAKDLLGACFIVEPDPAFAYQKIKETLTEKRIGLGLK
ncbi:MAG: anaerobic carbon-monoxide dehydrogenase catalytic subunit [Candidatus Coatesbacteria bacterium]|nr:anaerobic carbon-monoxide dehydrogenase catalytic subunit [Candidatus Coatesbacteria bacterium]